MVEFLIVRQAILILGCLLSTYTDLKQGLILDKITYPMIALGLVLNFFEPLLLQYLVMAGIVFTAGYLLYFYGKIGGGDVKLFTAISLLIPLVNGTPFVINVLFFAALTSVIFLGAYYTLRYYRKGIDLKENRQGMQKAGLLAGFLAIYFGFVGYYGWLPLNFIIVLAVPSLFALLFLALEQGIRKNFFLKHIDLKDLEEDELIALEHLPETIQKKLELKGKRIIGESEKKILKELNINQVPVYRDLPKFAPFVLLGVILALLLPNFFLMV